MRRNPVYALEHEQEGSAVEDLVLYVGITVIGYLAGAIIRRMGKKADWASPALTCVATVVVFTMGLRIGANDEVVSNLNVVGLQALILVISALVGTTLCLTVVRRIMGMNRFGVVGEQEAGEGSRTEAKAEGGAKVDKMTIFIVCAVTLGIALGYANLRSGAIGFEELNAGASVVVRVGLCTLLALIGIDLGVEGTVIGSIRNAGLRVLAIPFTVIAGTLLGVAACSIFLPLSLKECLIVGSGFGWYSLAPSIIMDHGMVMVSAISFMHNVLRELLSIITIPIVARHVGYIECCGLGGAAAMDVCLPIVERSSNGATAVYSFMSGLVLTIVVPILVPILCA